MWRKVLLLSVMVLQVFAFSSAEGADHDLLKGLKGVEVVIEPLPEAVKQINLTKDEIKRRIDEASKFVDIDQLALSPQCGFSSNAVGNLISVEDQLAKLRLVMEISQEIWG